MPPDTRGVTWPCDQLPDLKLSEITCNNNS